MEKSCTYTWCNFARLLRLANSADGQREKPSRAKFKSRLQRDFCLKSSVRLILESKIVLMLLTSFVKCSVIFWTKGIYELHDDDDDGDDDY